MENFWDYSVWGTLNLIAVLLGTLLLANTLKKVKFIRKSLIPTSVLAGIILLLISTVYNSITNEAFFDSAFFGGKGYASLEVIAYHMLALGFIASTLKTNDDKMNKQRSGEILNTGLTTVSTYLLQAVVGMIITVIASFVLEDFFPAAGVLLAFGYGQGTGQALNYGNIYETDFGFVGGKSFGLTIAAFGFLSASIGGVIHLHIVKKKNPQLFENLSTAKAQKQLLISEDDSKDGSLGKLTVQMAFIAITYLIAYGIMALLGYLVPSMKSMIYGFNFLIGVLAAILIKSLLGFLKKKNVIKKEYTDNNLLSNVSNFLFDLMIVAGIAAIRLDIITNYLGVLLILGVVGAVITYAYNRFVAKKLFPQYTEEQFMAMYGMLTGTASTGIVLLREIDPHFTSSASNNLIYQNLPAIVFGFPMMFLATFAPKEPYLTMLILAVYFIVLNLILFRSRIFKRKKTVE